MATVHGPWQDSCDNISTALQHMFKNEIIVDAVFKRDKVSSLYAHKLVLCIWSPKLADYITERNEKETFSITFSEDIDVLKIILKYLYLPDSQNFCFAKMPVHKLMQAIEICERFEIHQVYQKCKNSLCLRKLNLCNIIDCFEFGLRKNIDSILVKCIQFFEKEGVSWRYLKKDLSLTAIVYILSLDRIALQSEADLLRLAVAWLSFPMNHSYKSEVLSFIDFRAISWKELQDILKTFPDFFSDSDISSIVLGILKQDNTLFPDWYMPRIESATKKSCSSCMFIYKKLKIKKSVPLLRTDKRNILKFAVQEFRLQFKHTRSAKLLEIGLNFGPKEIPLKKFSLQISRRKTETVKKYSIDATQGGIKYIVNFNEQVVIKSKDSLTLKFCFHDGLLKNNVYLALLKPAELKKVNKQPSKDAVKIQLVSSKLAIYLEEGKIKKRLVSSFYFNICDNHNTYLRRRYSQFENVESLFKEITMFENPTVAMPSSSIHVNIQEEDSDVKMDAESINASTSDIKTHVKKEIIEAAETTGDHQESVIKHATSNFHDSNFEMDTERVNSSAIDTRVHIKEEIIDDTKTHDCQGSITKHINFDSLQHIKAEIIDLTFDA